MMDDIRQEISGMKQDIGEIKSNQRMIELTSETARELNGGKKYLFATMDRKMPPVDSVSLDEPTYQKFFRTVSHFSKSEGKHESESILPINAEKFPPDFSANDPELTHDDAHVAPLRHIMAFNQLPLYPLRQY